MAEVWRGIPIEGAEAYEVSDQGNFRSTKYGIARPHRVRVDADGWRKVALSLTSRGLRLFSVPRLVLLAFVGPPPSPKHHASYRDPERRGDNSLSNVFWNAGRRRRKNVRTKWREDQNAKSPGPP